MLTELTATVKNQSEARDSSRGRRTQPDISDDERAGNIGDCSLGQHCIVPGGTKVNCGGDSVGECLRVSVSTSQFLGLDMTHKCCKCCGSLYVDQGLTTITTTLGLAYSKTLTFQKLTIGEILMLTLFPSCRSVVNWCRSTCVVR